jgi:ribosome biogenesis protein ENP2
MKKTKTKSSQKKSYRASNSNDSNDRRMKRKPQFQQEKEENNYLSSHNYGVRVYDLEAKKSLEEIIKKSKLKAKYNEEARSYTELIEHLEFPIATNSMSLCSDGKYMWASGIYPPQIHCYELDQLTMKMSRHVEKEVLKMIPLSEDYRKLILLNIDRTIEVHAHFGSYYKFRIPVVGRDIMYHPTSAELLITGSSNEIYRFNLEEGMFKKSYEALNETCQGINVTKRF